MELKEMILHYRDTGQRVDEVLYQTVIEHIERAQELESAIKGAEVICNIATTEKRELEKQNKRMRETLEFYADSENYGYYKGTGHWKEIESDCGKRARKTLEETKNE